ncbi:MAG: gliding motility-associated C-terminal domain-containing protein [Chitinophagales bacterium]|jgi:gliding motility-associated-like protein|nr:gliding motility-associated C-terminal domain-containing protein [Chitinophagales bacterium]
MHTTLIPTAKWFFYSFIFLFAQVNQAQSFDAVKIQCVQNLNNSSIEIVWDYLPVTCGTFQEVRLYTANVPNGPFTLLTTITNANTKNYIHSNINTSSSHYYYLQAQYSCPSPLSSPSDTFTNLTFPRPEILYVTYLNDFPTIVWKPYQNKQVWGFPILYPNSIFDTAKGANTTQYTDLNATQNQPYIYRIAAMDSCGKNLGTSPFSLAHQTIYMTTSINACLGEVRISWNDYQGYEPTRYVVKVNKNQTGPQIVHQENFGNAKTYIYSDFNYNDSLEIFVEAYHPSNPAYNSKSNTLRFRSEKSIPPRAFDLVSSSFMDNNVLNFKWFCDTLAKFDRFEFQLYDYDLSTKVDEKIIRTPTQIERGLYSADFENVNPKRYFIKSTFLNQCFDLTKGLDLFSIYLNTSQLSRTENQLDFITSINNSSALKLKNIVIYRKTKEDPNFLKIDQISANTTQYIDKIEDINALSDTIFYKISVQYVIDSPLLLSGRTYSSISNSDFVLMRTTIQIPNAFKYKGINPEFKPLFSLYEGKNYSMKIYNRWGIEIFSSDQYDLGWNGEYQGKLQEAGTYHYMISYTSQEGTLVTKKGTFLLVH